HAPAGRFPFSALHTSLHGASVYRDPRKLALADLDRIGAAGGEREPPVHYLLAVDLDPALLDQPRRFRRARGEPRLLQNLDDAHRLGPGALNGDVRDIGRRRVIPEPGVELLRRVLGGD